MAALTVEIKLALLEAYVENGESYVAAITHVHDVFGHENCPSEEVMIGFIDYFLNDDLSLDGLDDEEYDSDSSIEQIVREPVLNIDARALHGLQDYFEKNPTASLHQAELDMQIDNWIDVAKEYFKLLHRYFVRIFHPSVEEEAVARKFLADNVLRAVNSQEMEIENVIFADIIHVNLDRYVYKGYFRYFGDELPYFSRSRSRHNVDLVVYAAISFDFIKIAFIEESEDGSSLVDVIKEQFGGDKLGDKKDKMWYIQDGTDTCQLTSPDLHSALTEAFGHRVIGIKNSNFYGGGIEYPSNTCFLSPCDFFLWGWLTSRVYEYESHTASDLKLAIEETIKEITPEARQLAIRTAIRRLEFMQQTNGEHSINVYI